jgi:hypothetical protein
MKELSPIWFIENCIDYEYQKYILLDYLQQVDKLFDENMLYPIFSDIEFHLKNLESFRTTRELIVNRRKSIRSVDFDKMTILYDIPDDTPDFESVNRTVKFAEGKFQEYYNKGKKIYQNIDNSIHMKFVGIIPNYRDHGFLIINMLDDARIYKYEIGKVYLENQKYIILDEIDIQRISLSNTYENIKHGLLKKYASYSNPAVLAAEIYKTYPIKEGIIPVTRRKLAAYINKI